MFSCPQNEQKDNKIMLRVQYLSTLSTAKYGIICATVVKYQKTNYLPPPKKKGKRNDLTWTSKDNKIVTKMPGAVFNMCHSQVTGSMFVTQPWSCRLMNTPPH
jgi:hypothetical protein